MTSPPSTPSGQLRAVGIPTDSVSDVQSTLRRIAVAVLEAAEMGTDDTRQAAAAQIAQEMRLPLVSLCVLGHDVGIRKPRPIDPADTDTPRPSRR